MKALRSLIIAARRSKDSNFIPPKQFSPDSSEMIGILIKEPNDFGVDGPIAKTLESLNRDTTLSDMNNWVHNPSFVAEPIHIESVWRRLEPVVQYFIDHAEQ